MPMSNSIVIRPTKTRNLQPPRVYTMQNILPISSPPLTPNRTWLDELPSDVCNRIASYVAARLDYPSAISLSNLSETQRIAVKRALSFRIDTDDHATYIDWEDTCEHMNPDVANLLRDDVREISGRPTAFTQDCLQPCFQSASLEKLVVIDGRCALVLNFHEDPIFVKMLDAITCMKNLRSLKLTFYNYFFKKLPFLKRLSGLDLREFVLEDIGCCLHGTLRQDPEHESLLASCFPRLEKLAFYCSYCNYRTAEVSCIWRMVEQLSALKELTLPDNVPSDAIKKLQEIDRVGFRTGGVFPPVAELADCIVQVSTIDLSNQEAACVIIELSLQHRHFEQLALCTKLEVLECCIQRGVERDLIHVVGKLRSLLISFDDEEAPVHTEADFLEKIYMPLPEPEPGAFLCAVKAAPFLKSLQLCNMRIRRSELRAIMMVLGERLEQFEEHVTKHWYRPDFRYREDKEVLEDEIATIETAAVYNLSLRNFYLLVSSKWFRDREAVLSLLPRLEKSVDILQRRAPFLFLKDLNELVRSLRKGRQYTPLFGSENSTEDSESENSAEDSESEDSAEDSGSDESAEDSEREESAQSSESEDGAEDSEREESAQSSESEDGAEDF